MDRDSLIIFFFNLGMLHKEILRSIALYGFILSRRHLIRILGEYRLCRRQYSDLREVIDFISEELRGPGRHHGYRRMYRKCLGHGLTVRKEDVRLILSELDPVSSRIHQRRRLTRRQYFSVGPNFIWHIDSYDKLKPYGICINGCIDGFSRKIIWLKAAQTNSDPHVIGGYFVEAIEEVGGGPRIVRTDEGTENVVVRDIQVYCWKKWVYSNTVKKGTVTLYLKVFIRRDGLDSRAADRSYIGGASTANQRIESWWGVMRKEGIEYWIQLLGELKDQGLFGGDFLDKALSQFCFKNIIQEQLNEIRNVWNTHRIRPSRNLTVPSGIPNMFSAPHLWGAEEHIVHVNDIDLATAKQTCKFLTTIPCDKDIFDLCTIAMEESGLGFPNNTAEALDLYISLRDVIRPQLFE